MGLTRNIGINLLIVLGSIGFVGVVHSIPNHTVQATISVPYTVPDIVDKADSNLLSANLTSLLVHQGTPVPYTGSGAPGINLAVATNGSFSQWVLEGWVNETAPQAMPLCHFLPSDWVSTTTDGKGQSGHGTFITLPAASPNRLPSDGAQCLTRIGAVGVYSIHVRIEGQSTVPVGVRRERDGIHYNPWDRQLDASFRVPS